MQLLEPLCEVSSRAREGKRTSHLLSPRTLTISIPKNRRVTSWKWQPSVLCCWLQFGGRKVWPWARKRGSEGRRGDESTTIGDGREREKVMGNKEVSKSPKIVVKEQPDLVSHPFPRIPQHRPHSPSMHLPSVTRDGTARRTTLRRRRTLASKPSSPLKPSNRNLDRRCNAGAFGEESSRDGSCERGGKRRSGRAAVRGGTGRKQRERAYALCPLRFLPEQRKNSG